MENKQDVVWLIKSIRNQLGISQEKLAVQLGVTFSSVNRWENGHRMPSPLAMQKIEEIAARSGLKLKTPKTIKIPTPTTGGKLEKVREC